MLNNKAIISKSENKEPIKDSKKSESCGTVITSIKKRGLVFLVTWVVLAVFASIYLVTTINSYKQYTEIQDTIINVSIDAFNKINGNSSIDMFKYFDKDTLCEYVSNKILDTNSSSSLWDLLDTMGYHLNYGVENYLKYTNFFDYFLKFRFRLDYAYEIGPLIIIYIIIFSITLLLNIWYILSKKSKLIIQDDTVVVKKWYGKTGHFNIKDINIIELAPLKGIEIGGNGSKYTIHFLKNAEELQTKITELISKYTNDNQELSIERLNGAETIKKYKELLENGTITQEEFDAKKKQLLGL